MSTPTATTAGSSSEHNQKSSEPSNPLPANSSLSKNSSPVEENSQVREGQKSSAAIADVPTVMSESTLRIIAGKEANRQAEKRKGPGSIPGRNYFESFWATVTTAEWKLYYQETGTPIPDSLVYIFDPPSAAETFRVESALNLIDEMEQSYVESDEDDEEIDSTGKK